LNDLYVLVTSIDDLAGRTLSNYLKRNAGFECEMVAGSNGQVYWSTNHKNIQLYITSGDLLTLENVGDLFSQANVFIFLSKHKSRTCIPTLTCHFAGNFSTSILYGGGPRQIAIAYPSLLKAYLKAVTSANHKVPAYEIVIEATHHGPTSINKPLLFIELGSSENQWKDQNAAAVVCNSLLEVLDKGFEHCKKIGIGLGGTHYPRKFNNLLLESEFALAAIASKHNLEAIDQEILYRMVERSKENVTHVVLDSSGLGGQKNRILKLLDSMSLQVCKI